MCWEFRIHFTSIWPRGIPIYTRRWIQPGINAPRSGEEISDAAEVHVAVPDDLGLIEFGELTQLALQMSAEQFRRGVPVFLGAAGGLGHDAVDQASLLEILSREAQSLRRLFGLARIAIDDGRT